MKNNNVQIELTEPCVIAGKDTPVGEKATVSEREARYLIGIGKAKSLDDEAVPKKRGRKKKEEESSFPETDSADNNGGEETDEE